MRVASDDHVLASRCLAVPNLDRLRDEHTELLVSLLQDACLLKDWPRAAALAAVGLCAGPDVSGMDEETRKVVNTRWCSASPHPLQLVLLALEVLRAHPDACSAGVEAALREEARRRALLRRDAATAGEASPGSCCDASATHACLADAQAREAVAVVAVRGEGVRTAAQRAAPHDRHTTALLRFADARCSRLTACASATAARRKVALRAVRGAHRPADLLLVGALASLESRGACDWAALARLAPGDPEAHAGLRGARAPSSGAAACAAARSELEADPSSPAALGVLTRSHAAKRARGEEPHSDELLSVAARAAEVSACSPAAGAAMEEALAGGEAGRIAVGAWTSDRKELWTTLLAQPRVAGQQVQAKARRLLADALGGGSSGGGATDAPPVVRDGGQQKVEEEVEKDMGAPAAVGQGSDSMSDSSSSEESGTTDGESGSTSDSSSSDDDEG